MENDRPCPLQRVSERGVRRLVIGPTLIPDRMTRRRMEQVGQVLILCERVLKDSLSRDGKLSGPCRLVYQLCQRNETHKLRLVHRTRLILEALVNVLHSRKVVALVIMPASLGMVRAETEEAGTGREQR